MIFATCNTRATNCGEAAVKGGKRVVNGWSTGGERVVKVGEDLVKTW